MTPSVPESKKLTYVDWLILFVAVLGFAFDIYELLMMPLIAGPAVSELLKVPLDDPQVRQWVGRIFWGSAMSGGLFGMLGGYLTDRFGRRRVLTYSILVYSFSALAAGFSTSIWHLFIFRCTTFIGVCVEFVAAVAWLAELFPNPRQREVVLGFTQAFSSVGGLLVTLANKLAIAYAAHLPAIHGDHASWRYTLISGLIPAIPLIVIRPFLPESPAWAEKKRLGTLKRPRFSELFAPELRRVTIVSTLLFACAYGAAFGAIQLVPTLVVPGLPELADVRKPLPELEARASAIQAQLKSLPKTAPERAQLEGELKKNKAAQGKIKREIRDTGTNVQFWQELGGLLGRVLLAVLAVVILSRRALLRIFQIPGLLLLPFVFFVAARHDLEWLKIGMFFAGLLTVAQFSFWGNYLPRVFPLHLRGTGEGFAANIGGRMLGTSAALVTTTWFAPIMPGGSTFAQVAYGAGAMVVFVYALGLVLSFWLPEPKAALDDAEPHSQPHPVGKTA